MDDFIDPFLSSPSWSEMNASGRSSWVESSIAQANGLLVDSVGTYERDEKSSSICMIPSSHVVGNMSSEDPNQHGHDVNPSALVNVYDISKGILVTENRPQQEELNHISSFRHTEAHENNFSLPGVTKSNSSAGAYGLESNLSSSVALPHGALAETCSIRSNGSELTAFPQSLEDSHSMTPVSSMWPPAYSSVPSLLMGQGKLQGLDLQGMENEADMLTKTCLVDGKFLQDHNNVHDPQSYSFVTEQQMKSNGFQPHQQEQTKLHNLQLPSLASGLQMSLTRPVGLNTREQSTEGNNMKHYSHTTSGIQSQSIPANASGCNAAAKPRVRARRGQATDPHSIAERLRREKIAERMKNLQELVPNSNKTDKASMLDEIIEYVKFLQLQVKVLSMSRLGAAGAVVPLITDGQAEASGGLHLSSTVGQGVIDPSESQDNLAFEQEVVKLMESSVTTAMQYLQNKGLCLMPIALASAISSQKGQSAAIPKDVKKSDATHGLTSSNGRDGGSGRANGAVIKQEQATKHTGNVRESKSKN